MLFPDQPLTPAQAKKAEKPPPSAAIDKEEGELSEEGEVAPKKSSVKPVGTPQLCSFKHTPLTPNASCNLQASKEKVTSTDLGKKMK